ncbi:hypothetical protein B0H14DRAFT_526800 [Mycena olivaceomarginata]|nr:hypothetical protein B0H14DRAFT_526800 [Mycena olivaceomarginata]
MWLPGFTTLYLGRQVSCKPQDHGSQFQSRSLGTATHASSTQAQIHQAQANSTTHQVILQFIVSVPSARPTLGGFWMCCSCLCVRRQLPVFIPARGESEADAGLGAHGCDDEVRRVLWAGNADVGCRSSRIDEGFLAVRVHGGCCQIISVSSSHGMEGLEGYDVRKRGDAHGCTGTYACTTSLRYFQAEGRVASAGSSARNDRCSLQLVVAQQLMGILTVSVLSLDPVASDPV